MRAIPRVTAGIVGLVLYYIGLFMYEDEEKQWQNALENIWVSIADQAKESGSKSVALFGKAAAIVTKPFDLIFGDKILSLRFIGGSICWSLAMECLVLGILVLLARPLGLLVQQPSHAEWVSILHFALALIVAGLLFTLLAILPTLWHSRWAVALSLFPICFLGFDFALLIYFHVGKPRHWGFFAGLVLSLLSDVALLALVRFTIKWIALKSTVLRTTTAIIVHLAVIYLLVIVPIGVAEVIPKPEIRQSAVLSAVVSMVGLNVFTALASCSFLFLLLLLLLHRILWPILARVVYPLARFEAIRTRKLALSIGSLCFLYAFPSLAGPAKALILWVAHRTGGD